MAVGFGKYVGVGFFLLFSNSIVFSQSEELLCLNKHCVEVENHIDKSQSLIETDTSFVPTSPDLANITEYKDSTRSDSSYLATSSKYYEILNPDRPYYKKRFMNVPSWDMLYVTNPQYEASRPAVVLKYFNKPRQKEMTLWEE